MTRLVDHLAPGMRVLTPTLSNESALLAQELAEDPDRASGVDFCGVQFPGIDTFNPLAHHAQAHLSAHFMGPAVRAGLTTGQASLSGLDYLGIARQLQQAAPLDLVIAQLPPPDAQGWCGPGLACDFWPLVWRQARRRVAHINPRMPSLRGGFRVHMSELDAVVEAELPLLDFQNPTPGDTEARIGQLVAELVRDGDTLQFGIGSVPLGLANQLVHHRRLRFWGGLASSALQTLWEAGAMDTAARLTTGVVLGQAGFRDFAARLDTLWLDNVTHTHSPARLAALPALVAINSAVEVDLFGQVNAERSQGVLQAGAGGLPAFVQGALASEGGRSLICLPSTARRGSVSRIVPCLSEQGLCTLPRYLTDTVVTEHGVAQVRDLSIDQRARALIAVADPAHREGLQSAWHGLRQRL